MLSLGPADLLHWVTTGYLDHWFLVYIRLLVLGLLAYVGPTNVEFCLHKKSIFEVVIRVHDILSSFPRVRRSENKPRPLQGGIALHWQGMGILNGKTTQVYEINLCLGEI